jgi:DNA polymerase-1
MIKVNEEFKKNNIESKLILQVHDELIFDCLNNEIDKVKEIVTNTMENVIKLDVPIKVSCDIGKDWYSLK